MGNYKDYFHRVAHQPKYFLGDRVFGRWNRIPFVGSVGNESRMGEEAEPVVSVLLDLPLQYQDRVYNVITVHPRVLKPLVEF